MLALLVASCGPAASDVQLLDDPRAVMAQGLRSTAAVHTMHVHAELVVRDPNAAQGPIPVFDGGSLDGDIDLANQEYSLSGASRDGTGRLSAIFVDQAMFTLLTDTGRWQKFTMPGGAAAPLAVLGMGMGAPQQPDVAAVLLSTIAKPELAPELVGVEDCGGGARCYRIGMAIPPQVLWDAYLDITGMRQVIAQTGPDAAGGMDVGQMPAALPPVTSELLFETSSGRLQQVRVVLRVDRADVQLTVGFGAFDAPLAIRPPPPQLVDDLGAMPAMFAP
jgi:hypothetical protein